MGKPIPSGNPRSALTYAVPTTAVKPEKIAFRQPRRFNLRTLLRAPNSSAPHPCQGDTLARMTRRPAGVVLSAIVLGLAAGLLILLAAVTLLGAVMMGHAPPPTTLNPGVATPPPEIIIAAVAAVACLYLALAVWAIATLVGLVRMRPWARISIMIIGAGLGCLGLFSALGCFAMPILMQSMPMPPASNPAVLHAIFIGMAVVSLLVATLGITWLVYFALRRTREAFIAVAPPAASLPNPNAPAPLLHAHALDYSVAEPLTAPQPFDSLPPAAYTQTWSQTTATIPQPTVPKRPVSITVLGIILLVGAVCSLSCLALPFPLFLCGFILSGWVAHITLLILIIFAATTGVGLLLVRKPAWYMAVAYCALSILNTLVMLFPAGRERMGEYMETVSHATAAAMPGPQPIDLFGPKLFPILILPGIVFGLAVVVFVIVLLWRARWAFEPNALKPQPQAAE